MIMPPVILQKKVKEWKESKSINGLIWPAQSPDLNPIKNLWNEVDKKLRNLPNQPKNVKDLEYKVKYAWHSIPLEYSQLLI